MAKLTEKEKLSIQTNYLGTPEAMYREDGEAVWSCELNSYGKVRDFQGEFKTECPFRYQGQYEDSETGLYYNRFRYYSPDEGMYISQDPIRLAGNEANLYTYVNNPNKYIDILGLAKSCTSGENSAAKRGRQKHDEYKKDKVKEGVFEKEFPVTLSNGKKGRIDAIDFENKIIYELKPDNPRAIARGTKQANDYKAAIEGMKNSDGSSTYGSGWTTVVDTY